MRITAIQRITWESISSASRTAPLNCPNGPWLTLSFKMLISTIQRSRLYQPRSTSICMPTLTSLLFLWTSTADPWLVNSTIWPRPLGQTSYMLHINSPSTPWTREPNGEAALFLVRYLKKSRDIGIRFRPDPDKGFECFCDADFSGLWNKQFARHDPSTAQSRSGWVVFYAVQSYGHLSFRLNSFCQLLKPNTSQCLNLYSTFSPSCSSFRKWRRKVFK